MALWTEVSTSPACSSISTNSSNRSTATSPPTPGQTSQSSLTPPADQANQAPIPTGTASLSASFSSIANKPSDYVAAIAQLRNLGNPNVNLLGYVDTNPLTIPTAKVHQDVLTYSNWSTNTAADIHVDGIFFDDMNGTYSDFNYAYYGNISTYTKATMAHGHQHVLFNPGAGVDPRYFALADEIIVFENYYSECASPLPFYSFFLTCSRQ